MTKPRPNHPAAGKAGEHMQTVIAGHYRFNVPEKRNVLYEERDIGVLGEKRILRSWLIQQADRTLSVWLDEALSPESMADVIESQTRKKPRLEHVQINGLGGTHLASLGEGWGRIEYWLKVGTEMICFCIQGPDIKSREDASDLEEVVKSVRFTGV